jgi:hypothetical protein
MITTRRTMHDYCLEAYEHYATTINPLAASHNLLNGLWCCKRESVNSVCIIYSHIWRDIKKSLMEERLSKLLPEMPRGMNHVKAM